MQTIKHIRIYQKFIKRPLDVLISLFGLIVLSPIIMVVAILVKLKLGSPVLFKQQRPGRNDEIFTLYKFRTMTNELDENGELLPETVRLTHFGQVLRTTSLDELPQLVNVLKGEMSIIGPRPLAVEYLPLYNDHQKRRHEVRPGITGLAQVNGRNFLSWEKRFNLDVYYVDHITFSLDFKILLLTIQKVIKKEDVYEDGEQIMDSFEGNHSEESKDGS